MRPQRRSVRRSGTELLEALHDALRVLPPRVALDGLLTCGCPQCTKPW